MLETVTGAQLFCMGGSASLSFNAIPETPILVQGKIAANIMDNLPFANLVPSGPCTILTAAALGVPTPCTPTPVSPWVPGVATVLIGGMPALDNMSRVPCAFGGMITIVFPQNTAVMVG